MIETQIYRNRRLLGSLIMRDLRLRYAGSSLGIFWSIIQPLILLMLYIIVFSTLMEGARISLGTGQTEVSYAVFLCPCLLAWNWICEALNGACNSVVSNAPLIKKTAFPIDILPCIPLFSGLIPFLVVLFIFFIYQFFFTLTFSFIEILLIIPVIIFQFLVLVGISYFVAALNVFIRDTAQVTMAVLQIMFWATPIVYKDEILIKKFPSSEYWFTFNPFSQIMAMWRDAVIAHRLPSVNSIIIVTITFVLFYSIGRFVYARTKDSFVEQI